MQNISAWGSNPSCKNNLTQLCQRPAWAGMALKCTLLVGSLLAMGVSAFAVPVTGNLGFSGTQLFSFTLPSPDINAGSYIDFRLPADGGNGVMDSDGTTGFFNIIPNNDAGLIKDLATVANSLGYSVAPVGATVSIDNFLSFTSIPTTNIRLTQLPFASTCTPSATVACIGPFQLSQNGAHVSVSINVIGDILNGPDTTGFSGQITAQFLDKTIAAVVDGASTTTGVLADSWSGAISATIPEPGTVTMLGIGLFAMFLSGLRSKNRPKL